MEDIQISYKIEVISLTHIYERPTVKEITLERRLPALSNVSLKIKKNDISLILGPSGMGKSTLLSIIGTLLIPTAGTIRIDEIEPLNLNNNELQKFRWKKICFMSQILSDNFISDWSVAENIDILSENDKNLKIKNSLVMELFKKFSLSERFYDAKIKDLSAGEQQRIAFILLILKNAEIFILDEPSSFLDEANKTLMVEYIKELQIQGKTVIIASHDNCFVSIAQNLNFIYDGNLLKTNTLRYISMTIKGNITIKGFPINSQQFIKIPNIIYQQLNGEKIHILKKINNEKYEIIPITADEFHQQILIVNWLLIENQYVKIPTDFVDFFKKASILDWVITKGKLEIQLSEHVRED